MSGDSDYDERIPREPPIDRRARSRRIAMIAVPLLAPALALAVFAIFVQPSYPPDLCRTSPLAEDYPPVGMTDDNLRALLRTQGFEVFESVGRENYRYALYDQWTLKCTVTCKIVWRVEPGNQIVEWSESTWRNDCS